MGRLVLVVLCVAACGDDSGVRHLDAHMADSPLPPPDGPNPDAPPQPVKLIVTTAGGVPNPGVKVYFQNADSSVVASMTTDVTGAASAVMAAGGYVTAINPYALALFGGVTDDVETFAGVKPGDVLRLDQASPSVGITVNITAPPDAAAGVVSYLIYASCLPNGATLLNAPNGSGAVNATGQIILSGCNGTADIMIVTTDDANNPLDYIYAPATAVVDQTSLDFTASAYTAATARAFTYTDTPVVDDSLVVQDTLVTSRGAVFEQNTSQGISAGPPINFTLQMPAFTGAFDVLSTEESVGGVLSTRNILDWAPYAATYTLDYQAHLVPDITDFPVLDTSTHTLSWPEAGGTLPAQLVVVNAGVFRQADVKSWNWNIAAPHDTKVMFPNLPTDVYDYNVAQADSFSVFTMVSANVPGGYDAARPRILETGPDAFINPTPGFVSYNLVQNNALFAPKRHKH